MDSPLWISAFLDLPGSSFERGVMFWSEVAGCRVSAPRGARREFATLVPPTGEPYLKVQRLDEGAHGLHLDLHVGDPEAAAAEAVSLGATVVADRILPEGYLVLSSPGGFVFCFVEHGTHDGSTRTHDGSTRTHDRSSAVDQVCLDIPSAGHDQECAFWAAVTGWAHVPSPGHDEFTALERPPGTPLRLLLQRLGESSGPVRAHFDLAAEDRAAEVRRHAQLGGQLVREESEWTVMRDPAGSAYCITDRRPDLGG
ncbi:VOC family protein [Nocardioides sp. Root151]|uniref:VOC family protein n=1 Tax=Nocardioides sp. Root151 TaxID=1736475 RepID=UPI0007030B54|nr:VOC family protein [Nocardioides sp. Root151]KQZ67310.1 hypothetical protein ASD66_20320 [Nocardioides sp. Root151]